MAERPRVAAGLAWGSIFGACSYALQRLYAAWGGEVGYAEIIAQEHVPYYWRAVLALFHAVAIGLIVGLGATDQQARASLGWIPASMGVVGALALAMGWVP